MWLSYLSWGSMDSGKINYRHRLTQINADKMKRAMPMPHFNIYRRER